MHRWCSHCNKKDNPGPLTMDQALCSVCYKGTDIEFDPDDVINLDRKRRVKVIKQLSEHATAGMSTVYLVERIDKPVRAVLKVANARASYAALKREVTHLQTLHRPEPHPHIVRLNYGEGKSFHDAIFEPEIGGQRVYFVALNYVDGGSLRDYLKEKGAFPLGHAARIISQAADALDHTHHKKIVHLDIKPTNILLNDRGQAVVIDYGVARPNTQLNSLRTASVGTATYNAPEQHDRSTVPDHRVDIYALGLTLYEMLTAESAIKVDKRSGSSHSLSQHYIDKAHKITPPRQVNPAIPKSVEKVILKAIAPNREKRYQTAGAFAADLRKAVRRVQLVRAAIAVLAGLALLAGIGSVLAGMGMLSVDALLAGGARPSPVVVVVQVEVTATASGPSLGLGGSLVTPSPSGGDNPEPGTNTPVVGQATATLAPTVRRRTATPTKRPPTATPRSATATPEPTVSTGAPTGQTLPVDLSGKQMQPLQPATAQGFHEGDAVEFRWRVADNPDCLPPPDNYGYEVRVWPDRNDISPMGAMDAQQDQLKITCANGTYSYTVGNISLASGVQRYAQHQHFKWDVAWVQLEPYQPLSWSGATQFNISLNSSGGSSPVSTP